MSSLVMARWAIGTLLVIVAFALLASYLWSRLHPSTDPVPARPPRDSTERLLRLASGVLSVALLFVYLLELFTPWTWLARDILNSGVSAAAIVAVATLVRSATRAKHRKDERAAAASMPKKHRQSSRRRHKRQQREGTRPRRA